MWDSRLKDSLPAVRERIARAFDRAGRGGDVRIVAVTKGHPADAAAAAVRAGLRVLGENRVQELGEKVAAVGRSAAEWHLIGHLQRNKARQALGLFDLIHSVDSVRLARTLSSEAERTGGVVRGLMQVNVSGEETKGGFDEAEAVDALGSLAGLAGVEIHGFMTMAPWTDDPALPRRTFRAARRLLEECHRQLPAALRGRELSMGMSNDFEIAVEEGATMLRLGTVLFGERHT
jgi:pyridoxal phosphate enzyme (YggS family)